MIRPGKAAILSLTMDQGKNLFQQFHVQTHPETCAALLEIHLHPDQVVQAQRRVVHQKAMDQTILHQDHLLHLKDLTDGDNPRA